jgi:hypothetical protein
VAAITAGGGMAGVTGTEAGEGAAMTAPATAAHAHAPEAVARRPTGAVANPLRTSAAAAAAAGVAGTARAARGVAARAAAAARDQRTGARGQGS